MIVAGGGVRGSGAQAELVALAEALQIPVATSLNGTDTIVGHHPLSVGVVGTYSRESANRVVNRADLVCFVGSETGHGCEPRRQSGKRRVLGDGLSDQPIQFFDSPFDRFQGCGQCPPRGARGSRRDLVAQPGLVVDETLAGADQVGEPLVLRPDGDVVAHRRCRKNRAKLGDDAGIDPIVLGQPARRLGKMADPLGIDNANVKPGPAQRCRNGALVATQGLHHRPVHPQLLEPCGQFAMPGSVVPHRALLLSANHIDIEIAFRNVDADNILDLCHPPIPSLLVRASSPCNCSGLGRREGDQAHPRSRNQGGIRSHLRGGWLLVTAARQKTYTQKPRHKGGAGGAG